MDGLLFILDQLGRNLSAVDAENTRLRAEYERLRAENEQLRAALPPSETAQFVLCPSCGGPVDAQDRCVTHGCTKEPR